MSEQPPPGFGAQTAPDSWTAPTPGAASQGWFVSPWTSADQTTPALPPGPPRGRSGVAIAAIIAGSVAVLVGLVVLTVIAAGSVQSKDETADTATVVDHDRVVSIVLPTDWSVDNTAPVGATDPTSDPQDPEYLAQIDGEADSGSAEEDVEVWVDDPVSAADHRDWHRTEVDADCHDMTCNHRGVARNVTIDGHPAIQQIIEDTRFGEQSWELLTTVRAANRAVLVTAYTDDPGSAVEAELTRQVASLRVLR